MRRTALVVLVALTVAWLLTGCDDDATGPPSGTPVIVSLMADPDTVGLSGVAVLTCVASDPDADSLHYAWSAQHGTINADADTATWTAPDSVGCFPVVLTVTDGSGAVASGTVEIEVIGGTLLIKTRNGLMAVDLYGESFPFAEQIGWVEVFGTRIFVARRNIAELNHDGELIGLWALPGPIPFSTGFVALADEVFVHLNNEYDRVYFMEEYGLIVIPVDMPEASPDELQNMRGVVVDNRLLISETGTGKLAAFDIDAHSATVWRDLHGMGALGDIDHVAGVYYLSQANTLYRFNEGGGIAAVATVGDADITGVAVVGNSAYLVAASSGRLYRVQIDTGQVLVMLEGLSYPQDIEYVPVDLEPSPGR